MSNEQKIYNQQYYKQEAITYNPNTPISYGKIREEKLIYSPENIIFNTDNDYNKTLQTKENVNMFHKAISFPQYQQNIYQNNDSINYHQNDFQQNIYYQTFEPNIYQQIKTKNMYQSKDILTQQNNTIRQIQKGNQNLQNTLNFSYDLKTPNLYEISNTNIIVQNQSENNRCTIIKKEGLLEGRAKPMTKEETDELYSYESAICKIKLPHNIKYCSGTGFFCEIYDDTIPFKKALFTNNHIINKKILGNNNEIQFEICEKLYKIKITKNRKVFTNEDLDYACIEIFDEDKIIKYFRIDNTIFKDLNKLINKEIFILQYPNGKLSHDCGKILDIKNNKIFHNVSTDSGSSGSPLIKRYNTNIIIGIHYGSEKDGINRDKCLINLATPIDIVIKDIKFQLFNIKNKIIKNKIVFRNKINLIYEKNNNYNYFEKSKIIFGLEFVKNNKNNIKLLINGEESELIEKYDLKDGLNNIQLIMLNKLTNIEYMFKGANSLKNIEGLKYLDTKEVINFSDMFYGCKSLSNINVLKNWDVSKGKNFSKMFQGCSSLYDINPLQNWNVSNGNNFEGIFCGCSILSDIKPLQNWNVSKGINFSNIFRGCIFIKDLNALKNWNVSKGNNFSNMFYGCSKLSDLNALQEWNVSNGINFEGMFYECSSLLNINALQNWNVSKGINFSSMFEGCLYLSNINALQNWNVSNSLNFSGMFSQCKSLSDINALKNWNVLKGNNFEYMFYECASLSDINSLRNWNVSNGNNFEGMFYGCISLIDIKALQNWNVSNGNNFSRMFWGCKSLKDIKELQNWNTSKGNNFEYMFSGCTSLSNNNNGNLLQKMECFLI